MDDKFRQKKEAEGNALMDSGAKYLETSIWKLKTSPDYDSAAMDFEKAVTCYKLAKNMDKAIEAALKTAHCYLKTNGEFHCAKMMEQVAYFYRDKNDLKNCSRYIEDSSNHYRNCGEIDSAFQSFDKLAKSIDQSSGASELHKSTAVELLKKAFQVGRISNRPNEAVHALDYAGKILLSMNKYQEALDLVKQSWEFYEETGNTKMKFRTGLHIALLSLKLGNIEEAQSMAIVMQSIDEELAGELDVLIKAFVKGDQKTVSKITMGQNFVYTENEFAKLGASLEVPESSRLAFEKSGNRSFGDIAPESYASGNQEFDEDDLS